MGSPRITLRLAWRNLWRNHRRTLIMLAAVIVGAWAMIFMTALTRGMVDEMVKDGIRTLPGHVQIHHPSYRDDPSVANSLAPPGRRLRETLDGPAVVAWAARVKVPAVVSSERSTRGVVLVGIDPERERALSFVAGDMAEGRFLESPEDQGLVVGRKLLDRLETDLGKRVVVMSQDRNNEIADRGFRVVGVYDSRLQAQEEGFVFAGRATVQRLLGMGDLVSEIAILGTDYRNVDGLRDRVEAAAGPGVTVEGWAQLDPYLGSMLGMMDGFVLVWIVVVFLALAFGLVNTLIMAVFERVREIGLMLALGMTPRSIRAQIIAESTFLLALGLLIGDVLAWLTIKPLESGIDLSIVGQGMEYWGASSVLYPALRWEDVVLANVVVLVLGFIASLWPAVRASRYEPVEAITKV
ncbi:MAG: FtsX-like permease family protein [Acidobacteria bacterium]|nr:FtsX-like permease family protein [Acidobacteriota bacterium]